MQQPAWNELTRWAQEMEARIQAGEITREQVNRILIESMPHMEGWSYENEGAGGAEESRDQGRQSVPAQP